jgi:hypothetical protein
VTAQQRWCPRAAAYGLGGDGLEPPGDLRGPEAGPVADLHGRQHGFQRPAVLLAVGARSGYRPPACWPTARRPACPGTWNACPPLHERIHSRCLNGGADDPDPGRLEHGIERPREAGVPVMQDELRSRPDISQVHEQVPGLLGGPGLDRVLHGAQGPDAPAAVLDHRKAVHPRAIEQVSGEEVQRQDPRNGPPACCSGWRRPGCA